MKTARNLTEGPIAPALWAFALPLMLGNVLQQFYNLADTWVVGRYVGEAALAAVGSSYTLLTFLTSVVIGLSLGTGSFVSMAFGGGRSTDLRRGVFVSSVLIGALTLGILALVYVLLDRIIALLSVPAEIVAPMRQYLLWVLPGYFASFVYNHCSNLLRAVGNSTVPLLFLGVAVVLNVGLDLLFVIPLGMGIRGAAVATVLAQYASAAGVLACFLHRCPELCPKKDDCVWQRGILRSILSLSGFTCLQQSVMNLGILMVQGVVNRFGAVVMAAFAVAVKIDTIAYMPVQDFGNAFSVFVAQNCGAARPERIRAGIRQALVSTVLFCAVISTLVFSLARPAMALFVDADSPQTIAEGVRYLRIEGACYTGIGVLFLLYGYFRAMNRPVVSVVLTVISLGTRVLLANLLSALPSVGVVGIWAAIPIGWVLADLTGCVWYLRTRRRLLF